MTQIPTIWKGAERLPDIPLWSRWGKDRLLARLGEIGSRAFARGFRQEVIEDEAHTFPSVVKCQAIDFDIVRGIQRHWPKYTGVDLSSEKRPGNTFVTIAQRPNDRKRFVIDVRAKALTSPEVWRELEEIDRIWKPQLFMVENNALQGAVLQWGHETNATLPVSGFTTGKNKADPDIGLPSLEVEFDNTGWVIPRPTHPLDCECAWCRLWMELLGHPIAESTDLVMALWFAREGARGAGMALQPAYEPLLSEAYRGN